VSATLPAQPPNPINVLMAAATATFDLENFIEVKGLMYHCDIGQFDDRLPGPRLA
jgi:hypothetical protein